jgi:hypothetical protein
VGATGGAVEVVGVVQGAAKGSKGGDIGAMKGQVVRLPASILGWSDRLGWQFDRKPLFQGRSDHLGSWSDHQPLFRA